MNPFRVMAGLVPAISLVLRSLQKRDAWRIGERSDAVLRTAMAGHDAKLALLGSPTPPLAEAAAALTPLHPRRSPRSWSVPCGALHAPATAGPDAWWRDCPTSPRRRRARHEHKSCPKWWQRR